MGINKKDNCCNFGLFYHFSFMNFFMKVMKKTKRSVYRMLFLTLFIFCYDNQVFAQEKVKLSVGIGAPELLNISVRIPIKQTQIGFSFGSWPQKNKCILSFSGDFYMHFAGVSKYSDRRPWYSRAGLNYIRSETSTYIEKFVYFNFRIGREINISKKMGVELDIGVPFQLFFNHIEKTDIVIIDNAYGIFPSFGLAVFYRL